MKQVSGIPGITAGMQKIENLGDPELLLGEVAQARVPERVLTVHQQNDRPLTAWVSGVHLLGVIDDVLDISRVEIGKYELVEETFVFEAVIRDLVRAVRREARENRLRLETELGLPTGLLMRGEDRRGGSARSCSTGIRTRSRSHPMARYS